MLLQTSGDVNVGILFHVPVFWDIFGQETNICMAVTNNEDSRVRISIASEGVFFFLLRSLFSYQIDYRKSDILIMWWQNVAYYAAFQDSISSEDQ